MTRIEFKNRKPALIDKTYFSFGAGMLVDYSLASTEKDKVFFSVHEEKGSYYIVPGEEKVYRNGKAVSRPVVLESCDRIECRNEVGVFFSEVTKTVESSSVGEDSFQILSQLSQGWEKNPLIIQQTLESLIKLSGGESGYLISESEDSDWKVIAGVYDYNQPSSSSISTQEQSRQLVSSTILEKAIQTKELIYVESFVGHPLENQASVIDAMIFSLACLPLVVSDRVFGALYLYTKTPGYTIKKDSLEKLKIIATQIALLLMYQKEKKAAKKTEQSEKVFGSSERPMIYSSGSPLQAVVDRIQKFAVSDLNILVRGESGTGKELVARAIHEKSLRNQGPFIAVNCAAIPPSLMESTLFGYVKGAFTGANKDKSGKFVQANNGTLFLDEIGDLPLDLQVKLLRVLQEKEVEAVGGDKPVKVDFRVIAATHQDIESLVNQQKFRQDLYYRLNGATLQIPSLKERISDVPVISEYLLKSKGMTLSEEALDKLMKHHWPGNVRELQQVLERGVALSSSTVIEAMDLELSANLPAMPVSHEEMEWQNLKEAQIAFTKQYIKKVLERFGGNRTRSASHLGVSERTLYRFLSDDSKDMIV